MTEDLSQIISMIDHVHEANKLNEVERDLGTRGYANPEHEYIEVEHNGKIICIDVLIYPLIKYIWDKGIETVACCQGGEQLGYISFSTLDDIFKFCDEFPYFKGANFDIINMYLALEGFQTLEDLTYDYMYIHTPMYGDLYSVRFGSEVLNNFQ
jgi:hypothetical protein